MDQICKEELFGFRGPYEWENSKILNYIKKKEYRILRPMMFWNAGCSILAGSSLLALVENGRTGDWKKFGLYLFLFCIGMVGITWIRKSRKEKQRILDKISMGDYRLMECRVFGIKFNAELISEASVKICNKEGQYCSAEFLLDDITARECKKDENVKVWLLKCDDDYYELLSEYRMGVGKR